MPKTVKNEMIIRIIITSKRLNDEQRQKYQQQPQLGKIIMEPFANTKNALLATRAKPTLKPNTP